jgi:hypothetical protein
MSKKRATTTGIYGVLPQGVLSKRVEMVEAIDYPALCAGG